NEGVILIAATNRPDVLDPALLRPGRFDRQVVVGLPDRPGREQILRIHTRELRLSDEVKFDILSQATIGMNGADLANLCNEAALIAARDNHMLVSMADFEQALDKIILGEERPLVMNEAARKVIAYHEAGHAVVAWFTQAADPVHKVTIIPHGRALGVTEQLPVEDVFNYSRTALLARLVVMFGGRAAEEIALGEITTGAENDIIQATRLARRMIARWAMGGLGSVAYDTDEEQPFLGYEISQGRAYSETTAAQIDNEVVDLLNRCHQNARDLLNNMRGLLDRLVGELMEHETIEQEVLTTILGPRLETADDSPMREGEYV
ncbi:MAG: AAA family ATPase, partial [Omnitrophica WOR_2 bacterium]